jgi:hypothetical protein
MRTFGCQGDTYLRIILNTAEQQALEHLARQKGQSPEELIKDIAEMVIRGKEEDLKNDHTS